MWEKNNKNSKKLRGEQWLKSKPKKTKKKTPGKNKETKIYYRIQKHTSIAWTGLGRQTGDRATSQQKH